MKKIVFIIFVAMLLCAPNLWADEGNAGAPASFLKLNLSARVLGMGGAYTAISDDAVALFYNPAGAPQPEMNGASASYRAMDLNRRMGYVAVNLNAREGAALSLGWIYAGDGEIYGRDNQGYLDGEQYGVHNNTIAVAFSRKFGRFLSLGATGKYFITKVANISSSTVGFDLGAMLILDRFNYFESTAFFDMVRVGLVVENLGATYRWSTGDYWSQYGESGVSLNESFSIGVKGGVSALALDSSTLISVELEKYQYESLMFFGGVEHVIKKTLALRGGYANGRITFGGGLVKKFIYYNIRFDYAFASARHGEGSDHLFTVGVEFR